MPPVLPTRSIDDRLRALEERVDLLFRMLIAARDLPPGQTPPVEPLAAPVSGAPAPQPPAPAPAPRVVRERISVEAWIGRYGTLALAALTILLGVGAFLSWAITSGRLGPWARVALGALGAAALASVGASLRRSPGTKAFGNILLALGLAVVHVCAWGAGPRLQLVSPAAALAVAALASAALASLALREDEQALFNVGFGGALIGPFVTSRTSTPESAWFLLGYGLIVLAAGLFAARSRAWRNPPVVFILACGLYTASASAMTSASDAALALTPGVFAILCACLALGAIPRELGARWATAALLVAATFVASRVVDGNDAWSYAGLATLVFVTALAAAWRDQDNPLTRLVAVWVIPIWTLFLVVDVLDGHALEPWLPAAWAAALAGAAWPLAASARKTHLTTAALCGGGVFLLVFEDQALMLTLSLSGYAAAVSLVMARLHEPSLAFGAVAWLVVATFLGFIELTSRTAYAYRPFLTLPSLGALAYSTAWVLLSFLLYPLIAKSRPKDTLPADIVRVAASLAVLLWGRQELVEAFSADASVLLLIVYYAVAGVALIFVGRLRQSPTLRRAGLALGIYAALKAVLEASALDIGFRVGSYLLSGLFLLAVAYWYRKTNDGASE